MARVAESGRLRGHGGVARCDTGKAVRMRQARMVYGWLSLCEVTDGVICEEGRG